MKKYQIKCNEGIDDILFGMSPEEVRGRIEYDGKHVFEKNEDEIIYDEFGDIRFHYKQNELICISSDISVSRFIFDGEDIPYTLFSILRFLKEKSQLYLRFPGMTGYLFVDLGLVIYPVVIHDFDAGTETFSTKYRLAICNKMVLYRYYICFFEQTEKREKMFNDMVNIENFSLIEIFNGQLGYCFEEIENQNEGEFDE